MSGWGSRDPGKTQTGLSFNPDWALCPLGDLEQETSFPQASVAASVKGQENNADLWGHRNREGPQQGPVCQTQPGAQNTGVPHGGGEWAGMPCISQLLLSQYLFSHVHFVEVIQSLH